MRGTGLAGVCERDGTCRRAHARRGHAKVACACYRSCCWCSAAAGARMLGGCTPSSPVRRSASFVDFPRTRRPRALHMCLSCVQRSLPDARLPPPRELCLPRRKNPQRRDAICVACSTICVACSTPASSCRLDLKVPDARVELLSSPQPAAQTNASRIDSDARVELLPA